MNSPTEFTLEDRDGNPHEYFVTPLVPSKSVDIALEILACIAKPGARLIRLGIEAKGLNADSDTEEIKAVLAEIDWTELATDAESVIRALAQRPALVRRLFHGTLRGGQELSKDAVYDIAYAANWGEWYGALKGIVDANGLIPFLDSLSS